MNETAQTILSQLSPQGVRGLRIMLGAGPFAAAPNSVSFRFKGSKVLNHAEIRLNGSDTCDMTPGRVGDEAGYTQVSQHTGLYNEDLRQAFEHAIGLATAIPWVISASDR